MPKTVLHLIETGGPGGAEKVLVHLATRLGPDYRSEAALIRDSWLASALRGRGVPVNMLKCKPNASFVKLGDLSILRDILRLTREKQVALLHTHEFLMNTLGLVVSKLTGIPAVATVHGKNYYVDRFRRRVAYRLVGRFGGRMVSVSDDVRRFLVKRVGVPSRRIQVIPNGVPFDGGPSEERISTLRKSLGLDPDTRVVGTVGSLYPVKGHRYLIDAAPLVVQRFSRVVFLMVGRGQLRQELEAQTQRLAVTSRFRFLDHRDDVRDLLAICDVFVLPSLSEGMPLALLEAMAAGVAPVVTHLGGVTEVVENGKTGLLVPPADSDALAWGIIALLENETLAREIGEAARDIVARRFSVAGMVRGYLEVYEELLRKSERTGFQT